jgi:hypothetical protein
MIVISPIDTDYIKKGKEYLVKENHDTFFTIDKKDLELKPKSDLICLFKKCTHLKGKNWKVI